MNGTIYDFLASRVDEEIRRTASVPGIQWKDAELGRGLLLSRLKDLVQPVLDAWLEEELTQINPAAALSPFFVSAEDRERAEQETVRRVMSAGKDPFTVYPLLRQDADRIGENFRSFLQSFLRRLSECSDRISRKLLSGREAGRLISLSASGADAHLHGRSALRVECEGGVFYYKPRDSRIDRLYAEIVAAFCPECTRSPEVVCGDGYGFIECMKTAPIRSLEEAAAYYRNFGALTALFRFLGTSDMHYENILACGIHPVAIDLETLLTPVPDPYNGCEISSVEEMNPVWRDILFSTQGTLVLPMMLQGKVQISPLLCDGLETAQCLPMLERKRIPLYGFEEEFLGGFDRMYDRLLLRRGELAEMARKAENMSARFVMRASAYYAVMLKEMHSPEGCASAENRAKVLDDLKNHFKDHPEYLPMTEWERACLEEGDIPYFSFRAGKSALYGDPQGDRLMDGYFGMTALDRCILGLEHSGPREKQFELDYIRRRFRQGPDVLPEEDRKAPGEASRKKPDGNPLPVPAEEAKAQALKILEDLWDLTLELTDGDRILLSANRHLVPEYHVDFERGLPGMSLFFDRIRFACSGETRGDAARKAACLLEETGKDLLRTIRTYQTMTAAFRSILHPGICKGPGGLFFSPCLNDGMLEEILSVLNLTGRAFEEEKPGLADGIGGLMLACTVAYTRMRNPDVKKTLASLVDRLTAMLQRHLNNPKPSSGLSQGMAGVGLALVQARRLRLTGNSACAEMTEKAFRLELDQYRDVLGGWPDYGRSSQPVVLGEHLESGAPGIALAAVLCEQDVPAAKTVADKALECTLRLPFQETDDLATGNVGIALALTVAARRRGDPELLRAAGIRLSEMAVRAERDGGYRSLPCRLRNAPDPAFWYGIAGVGYAMLVYAEVSAEISPACS